MSFSLYFNGKLPQHLVTNSKKGLIPSPKKFGFNLHDDLHDALCLRMISCLNPMVQFLDNQQHVRIDNRAEFHCLAYFKEENSTPACCQVIDDQHYIHISTDLIEKLALYSIQIGQILVLRNKKIPDLTYLKRTVKIDETLSRQESLTDIERKSLLESVRKWPIPEIDEQIMHDNISLTEMVIFHDMLRLIFTHEFAHTVAGHTQYFQKTFGIQAMPEVGVERYVENLVENLAENEMSKLKNVPTIHKLQALELHADVFSLKWSVNQIICGHDPIGITHKQPVDLVDRLCLFNIAACLITINWTISDYQINPLATYRVKYAPLDELNPYAESGPDVIFSERNPFKVIRSTHPPAQLRYYRHFIFVEQLSMELHSSELGARVGANSQILIRDLLGVVSVNFYNLLRFTYLVAMTPEMYILESYDKYMAKLSSLMADEIKEYIPQHY